MSLLLPLLIIRSTLAVTIIPSNGSWVNDDYAYSATGDPITDPDWVGWYRPDGQDGDMGIVESCNSACTRDPWSSTTEVHGWYDRNNGREQDDFNRAFSCNHTSTVTYELTVYFCRNGNNQVFRVTEQYAGSSITLTGAAATSHTIFSVGAQGSPSASSTGISYNTGTCSDTIRSYSHTASFIHRGGGSIFFLSISQTNAQDNNNGAVAFNNFRIKCDFYATPNPTAPPTSVPGAPTPAPTDVPTPAPTDDPTPAPTDGPSVAPSTPFPSVSPTTALPTDDPTTDPTNDPTKDPTMDPTENPTPKPTSDGTNTPTESPTKKDNIIDLFDDAFGAGGECKDGWIKCNELVFIILVIFGILFVLYWIFGCVWYFWRQKHRPMPAHMMVGAGGNQGVGATSVEMNQTGAAGPTHATADRWKSAWEIEQEQKRAAEAQGAGAGGDGNVQYGGTGNMGGGGGAPGYY